MLGRRHYNYLADTIINDPDINELDRVIMYEQLGTWFNRDFNNFDMEIWNKRWRDRFRKG